MARKRYVKPGFFLDADLADCGPHAMILFEALWCHADKNGRLKDKHREIKPVALPFFDIDVDELLATLAGAGFIDRYSVKGKDYLEIVNWHEHQAPHANEPDLYPANPHPERVPQQVAINSDKKSQNAPRASQSLSKSLSKEPSTALEPSPLKASSSNSKAVVAREAFEMFWAAYPRKQSKQAAWRAWRKLDPSEQLQATMIAAVEQAKTSEQWRGGVVPHAATWINGERWEDEPDSPPEHPADIRVRELLAEAQLA